MQQPVLATSHARRDESSQSQKRTVKTPPLFRLQGGDIPHGGTPASVGHAGRSSLLWRVCAFFVATLIVLSASPHTALASIALQFPNGGTAQLEEDGTISGLAHVGDYHNDKDTFDVIMPDGTTVLGQCLDPDHYVPAPGDFPFVATPLHDGSYEVTVDSTKAERGPQPYDKTYLEPAQRVGDIRWNPTYYGWLKIQKSSALPNVTKDNSAYSLSNAHYLVFSDKECTSPVDTAEELVTDALGETPCVSLEAGTYWVKEDIAPKGYLVDVEPHQVTIVDKTRTTLDASDTPLFSHPDVWATKTDAELGAAQGSCSLADAQFVLRFYAGAGSEDETLGMPTRTWVVKSDEQGNVFPSERGFVSGGTLYHDQDGNVILPYGILTIQEAKAPHGYWLEGESREAGLDYEAPIHTVVISNPDDYETPVIADHVRRCGISLQKADAQTGTTPQGDASLEGIEFSIVNRNEQAVVVNGTSFEPGQTIGTIVTDKDGVATTSDDYLPIGTYEVRETASNGSYVVDAQSRTITLTSKATNTIIRIGQSVQNHVVRGGIAVGKISHEVADFLPQGDATLTNAVFSITLQSQNPVCVNGSLFRTGDVVTTLRTNDKGLAHTDEHALPFGTYLVQEVEAPTGYLLNTSWSKTVEVREDGVTYDLATLDESTPDQVKRGGFSLNKVDELTKSCMPRVPWRITSDTTGESHILVTSNDGVADTERCKHSLRTNANDAIVQEDGSIDEELIDLEAGIWFTGRTDVIATAHDDVLALPYDTYTVEELRSPANEDHDLVSFRIRVHSDGFHADMGDIVNRSTQRPSITTTLTYANDDHVAPAAESVTLTDTVSYNNLPIGEEYRLVGTLVSKVTQQPLVDTDGSPVVQTLSFTPVMPSGAIDMSFEVDTSGLIGTSIVAYEELFKGDDIIATHKDIDDAEQTVAIPSLRTTLSDKEGNHEVCIDNRNVLIDVVEYHNLLPNVSYEMQGVLMDKDTKEPLVDENGEELRGATSFVPEQSDGTVNVSFMVPEKAVAGKMVVAYESLNRFDVTLTSHNDPEDAGQTVCFPDIQTELTDTEGHHAIPSSKKIELIDTVTFRGLVPGDPYKVEGVLMDKRTGDPLKDDGGNAVTSTLTFVPSSPVGSTSLSFIVDASMLQGTEIVAFETLFKDERQLVVHADLEDRAQTVHVAFVQTMLTSEEGTHEAHTGHNVLTDTVSYSGLRPGIPHTVFGVLVNAESAEPIKENDKDLSRIVEFTPESPDGEVQVAFELDATPYLGQDLVAYEYLYEGSSEEGRLLAAHEDPSNPDQTVSVPYIATTACDASDGDKTIEGVGKVRIRDTVSYAGLEPGSTYTMLGTIFRSSTKEPLQTKDGTDITAQATFEPKSADGTIDVEFEFDSELADEEDLVVFESCTKNGVEIASHASLDDKNQTIHVKKPSTPSNSTKVQPNDTSSPADKGMTYASPSTGDVNTLSLAGTLALFGIAALTARKLLR